MPCPADPSSDAGSPEHAVRGTLRGGRDASTDRPPPSSRRRPVGGRPAARLGPVSGCAAAAAAALSISSCDCDALPASPPPVNMGDGEPGEGNEDAVPEWRPTPPPQPIGPTPPAGEGCPSPIGGIAAPVSTRPGRQAFADEIEPHRPVRSGAMSHQRRVHHRRKESHSGHVAWTFSLR